MNDTARTVPGQPGGVWGQGEDGRVAYHGRTGPLAKLLIKGWLFVLLTLGIYRFWLITDARRFLWGHTEVAGDFLEYTGRGLELFLGFLIALAVLTPFYVLLILGSLGDGVIYGSVLAVYIAIIVVLGQFAIFRAWRYRLTRTVHRGIRLGLGGAGFAYAGRAIAWAIPTLLTLGLTYPWQAAALNRYLVGNVYYGDLQASFTGQGADLFKRMFLLQLVVLGPLWAGALYFLGSGALAGALDALMGAAATQSKPDFGKEGMLAAGWRGGGLGWLMLAGLFLYPVYRAIIFRWWVNGINIQDLSLTTHLGTWPVYKMYLKYIGATMVMGMALSAVVMIGTAIVALLLGGSTVEDMALLGELVEEGGIMAQVLVVGATALTYILFVIGYAVLYQLIIWAGFWNLAAKSTTILKPAVLDRAKAAQKQSNALGEGLADALDFGGF